MLAGFDEHQGVQCRTLLPPRSLHKSAAVWCDKCATLLSEQLGTVASYTLCFEQKILAFVALSFAHTLAQSPLWTPATETRTEELTLNS